MTCKVGPERHRVRGFPSLPLAGPVEGHGNGKRRAQTRFLIELELNSERSVNYNFGSSRRRRNADSLGYKGTVPEKNAFSSGIALPQFFLDALASLDLKLSVIN